MEDEEALFAAMIGRVRAGDEAAAAELVRRFEPEIRLEIRMRLRMRDARLRRVFDSVDIAQSVLGSFFVRAALGQYDLDDPSRVRGLLVGMARNKLAEAVRRQQRDRRDVRRVQSELPEDGPVADDSGDPGRIVATRDLLREVRGRLSEEERSLADLRAQGRGWVAIATELGGTAEGRRKQLSRAADRVSRELGLDDPGPA